MLFDKLFKKEKGKSLDQISKTECLQAAMEYYSEGKAHFEAGRYIQAMEYLQAALQKNPNGIKIQLKLAQSYTALGKYGEADIILEQLLALHPENKEAQVLLDYNRQQSFKVAAPQIVQAPKEEEELEIVSEREHYAIDEPYDPRLDLRDYKFPSTDILECAATNDESLLNVISSDEFANTTAQLPVALGIDNSGKPCIADIVDMPHLLVSGLSGFGKTTLLNAMIMSIIFKKHPAEVKLILMGDRRLELAPWRALEKHFLAKLYDSSDVVVTDERKAVRTLNALCIEMDNRLDLFKDAMVRNIKDYNTKFIARNLNPQKEVGPENYHRFLPYIVVFVDEFTHIIASAGREVEQPIVRISQLSKTVGIHLVIASRQCDASVFSTALKLNFQSRLSFKVARGTDSNAILGERGAQQLNKVGEMLFKPCGGIATHIQGCYVSDEECDKLVNHVASQRGYPEAYYLPEYLDENDVSNNDLDLTKKDVLFEQAARLVVASQLGSTSLLQRKLELGYIRAGKIMDQFEAAGIVGSSEGSKAREVLVKTERELEAILRNL